MKHKGTLLGAISLVAGTCIGGGMLALPVATASAGFFPSLVMILLGWAFMTTTALLLLEVNLWMEEDVHIITMASRLLGPIGKAIAWVLYLFIGYASLVAYTAGGGTLLQSGFKIFWGLSLPQHVAETLFILIFGLLIYLGNIILGRINTFLMFGLVAAYVLLVTTGFSAVEWHNLLHVEWKNTLLAAPLLLTIFSFQTIVPSLTIYLKRDGVRLRWAIVIGTTLALVIYLIWEWLVLGAVPLEGEQGLNAALAAGKPATEFLRETFKYPLVALLADFFAFFALVTSFLGIALGLFDFLADGLKIKRERWGNFALGFLVIIPTLFFTVSMERCFLRALDSSGGIGDTILNGILPALMVWVGRYQKKFTSEFRFPGGKVLIIFVIAYALAVFAIEMLGKFGIMRGLS